MSEWIIGMNLSVLEDVEQGSLSKPPKSHSSFITAIMRVPLQFVVMFHRMRQGLKPSLYEAFRHD